MNNLERFGPAGFIIGGAIVIAYFLLKDDKKSDSDISATSGVAIPPQPATVENPVPAPVEQAATEEATS